MRKMFVFATLAFFAGAGPAAAQGTFGFGAHAGVSLPTGDYGDVAETGFSGGVDLTYPLASVAPGLSWYTSADVVAHSVENVDDGFLYFPLMTGLRFDIPVGPIGVFLNGQLGAVFAQPPSVETAEGEFSTNFGFNFGGGVHITENAYAGVKYYPLGGVDLEYGTAAGDITFDDADVSFLDIYVGFGVF